MNLLGIYTPQQLTEMSIREKQRRQKLREVGEREADSFMFNNILKAKRNRDKINCRKYRQRW